jgi:uncharacterized coiled-coil protein SlyX
MFRKVLAASTAALLVSLTLNVAPANAAVKNGTPCSKAGATTKSGGSTFKCIKYALVKNSKLTWRTTDCISAVNSYVKTNSSVAAAKSETASLQESITALTPVVAADVKIETDRIASIKVKLDAMKADAANLTKNAKNIKDYETAISWREIAVKRLNSQLTAFNSKIKKMQNEKGAAANNLSLIESSASTALMSAKTICA